MVIRLSYQEVSKTLWVGHESAAAARKVQDQAFKGRDKCRSMQLSSALGDKKEKVLGAHDFRANQLSQVAYVTISHTKLSQAQTENRGGDKVKLVSLVSC